MNKPKKKRKNPDQHYVYCTQCGDRVHKSLTLNKNKAKGMGHSCKPKKP